MDSPFQNIPHYLHTPSWNSETKYLNNLSNVVNNCCIVYISVCSFDNGLENKLTAKAHKIKQTDIKKEQFGIVS